MDADWFINLDYRDNLPALRAQRQRLLTLTADIVDVQRHLVNLDPAEFWRSRAQRAYRDRVEEIVRDVCFVLHLLNEVQDQIWRKICLLESEE